jgi:DNA-nicking Smr family endonuclease
MQRTQGLARTAVEGAASAPGDGPRGCRAIHNEMDEPQDDDPMPRRIPIDGVLDLHTFRPREVKDLVGDYLAECRKRGILEVRIIHGKGSGALMRTVHALLERNPIVCGFRPAPPQSGGWGATLVQLTRPASGERNG